MGEPNLDPIVIDNFSSGIFADLHGFSGATATANASNVSSYGPGYNGGATVDDTFGCTADASGALVPLPARTAVTQSAWQPFAGNGETSPNNFPTGKVGYYTLDARVISYMVTDDHDAQTESDGLFILFGAFYDPDDSEDYRQLVWGVVMGLTLDMWKTVYWNRYAPSIDPSPALSIPSGSVSYLRSITGERDADGFFRYDIYTTQNTVHFMVSPSRDGSVGDDNTSWATGAIPAEEVALTSYTTDTGQTDYPLGVDTTVDTYSGVIGIFPDPLTMQNPPLLTDYWYPRFIGGLTALPGYMSIAHQGRAVMASLLSRGFGDGFNVVLDRVSYSPVYNPSLVAALVDPETTQFPNDYRSSIAGDDNPNPIGVLGSIQASELLVVKHGRGGVLMRGDMDNFEAVALPYIESTYGVVCQGINTPIGFVYGSKTGVWVWSGGQTSEKLSKQIDAYFWQHDPSIAYAGNQGRMAYWQPYICVPNDYLFNTDTGSWWKLEDSADVNRNRYSHYDVSSLSANLYAIPYKHTPGADPTIYTYDPDVLRSSYSWKSLPIIESRRRLLTFQDVEITFTLAYPWNVASTITVTLTGLDETGNQIMSNAITFTPNVSSVEYGTQVTLKHNVNASASVQGAFTAKYVQVKVEVSANSGPAPKVHRIALGVRDAARQRVAN